MAPTRRRRRSGSARPAGSDTTFTVPQIAFEVLKMLDDLVLPALDRLLPAARALAAAGTSDPVLDGFTDRDAAQDGLASLHFYLAEAIAQARRIRAAK